MTQNLLLYMLSIKNMTSHKSVATLSNVLVSTANTNSHTRIKVAYGIEEANLIDIAFKDLSSVSHFESYMFEQKLADIFEISTEDIESPIKKGNDSHTTKTSLLLEHQQSINNLSKHLALTQLFDWISVSLIDIPFCEGNHHITMNDIHANTLVKLVSVDAILSPDRITEITFSGLKHCSFKKLIFVENTGLVKEDSSPSFVYAANNFHTISSTIQVTQSIQYMQRRKKKGNQNHGIEILPIPVYQVHGIQVKDIGLFVSQYEKKRF
ncbi:hypothetical protein EDC96DRAFT_566786 [Choanephora cucurbitarum]|nr:hypothetical protein EDC96DRAFT_566786 [Choanephora cucurbitarum]